ncbi:MAG: OsmC family protein [Ferruginibacter sp.]
MQRKHLQSGSTIETDAPTDNRGKGERFSPTDLVCTALATCIITTMAMKATDMNIELKGTEMIVKKHMLSDPRRIGKIDVTLTFPSTLQLDEKEKTILQRVGDNCPVTKSLNADIEVNTVYNW